MATGKISCEVCSLKAHEDELVELLENSDLNNFTREGAEIRVIPQNVKQSFDSMDPDVPRPRQLRYLLLHAYERLEADPRLYEHWLKVLAKHGTSREVLTKVKHTYDSLRKTRNSSPMSSLAKPDLITESGTGGLVFGTKRHQSLPKFQEKDISPLTELIASGSSKWRNICINLNLPEEVCKNIEGRIHMYDDKVCLKIVLREWIVGNYDHAKAPTLKNLKETLASKTVGLGKMANMLCEDNLNKHGIDLTNVGSSAPIKLDLEECYTKKRRTGYDAAPSAKKPRLEMPAIDIGQQPLQDVEVDGGKSTLLEIQAVAACENAISYQWIKDGCPLSEDEYYVGTNKQILCVSNAILASKGTYTCELKIPTELDQTFSDTFSLTVSLTRAEKTLVDMYKAHSEVKKESWPPVANQTYIKLALINQGGIEVEDIDVKDECTIQGAVDDIMGKKESIEYDKAFSKQINGAFVLVEGRPGSGKTTLVHKIATDWAKGNSILKGAKLVFLISLRVLSKKKDVKMMDILKSFYHDDDTTAHSVLDDIQQCNGEGVCFIMDGLDEYPNEERDCDESIVFKIIQKKCFHLSMVIVASRPIATAELRNKAHAHIDILGFMKEEIFDYISSYPFTGRVNKANTLKSYLTQHKNILHMCYLPVNVSIICFLYNKMGGNLPHTECGIYEHFTLFTLLRKINRKKKPLKSVDDLRGDAKEMFNRICKLAFDMTTSSIQVFEEEKLSLDDASNVDPSLGLVSIDFTAGLYGFQNLYTFVHLTFQEYLAAYYISKLEEKEQAETISMHGKKNHMQIVWKFYCGLVSFKNREFLFEQILNLHDDHLFRCQCAFESQQPITCKYVFFKECSGLTFHERILNPADFVSIGYVISNTSSLCRELKLKGIHSLHNFKNASLLACSDTLKLCSEFQSLDLSMNDLDDNCMKILASGLEQCVNLWKLDLSWNGISVTGIKTLTECLTQCSNLEKLYLYSNKIGCSGAKCLAESLKKSSKLEAINLGNNAISDDGVKALAEGLKHCSNLKFVDLGYNQIGDDSANGLARSLKLWGNLQFISLRYNLIGDNGVNALAESLKHCSLLYHVDLTHNVIDDDGASGLAEGLKHCSNLMHVDLGSNQIGDVGANALAGTLKHCSLLFHVDLGKNRISDDGASGLAKSLKHCSNLEHVGLGFNQIGDYGTSALAEGLKHCSNLRYINLGFNQIGDYGTSALAEGLKHCSHLRFVDLGHNVIGDVGAKALANGLNHCSQLKTLLLWCNRIGRDGANDLAEGLKQLELLTVGHARGLGQCSHPGRLI